MTNQNLEQRILAHTDLLHRISCALLRSPQDREDAVQTAIETAWRKAKGIKDESKFKPWLTRVMINACYGILRKKRWEVPVESFAEKGAEISQDAFLVRDALEKLPDSQRLPLILHYFEGFSIKEAAKALGCSQGTVLSRIQRGREKLKQLLGEDNNGR
ncbi:MAG: RNA polymerase sigma factor [Clostridiales bacterium]|nr:RNA polymerase sigma factor [Clostridiales bacterium]